MKVPKGNKIILGFVKEWLLPKLGTAYAVFLLARIIVAETKNSSNPASAFDALDGILKSAGNLAHMWFLGILGTAYIVTQIIKIYASFKPPLRMWFKFSRYGSWFSVGVELVAGTLLVPLTLWLVVLMSLSPSRSDICIFAGVVLAYVMVSFAMYWQSVMAKNDSIGAVIWNLTLNKLSNENNAIDALNDAFQSITWVGAPEVISSSADGHLVIEMPILHPVDKWPVVDVIKFIGLLDCSGDVLKSAGIQVAAKNFSPKLLELIKIERAKKKRKS